MREETLKKWWKRQNKTFSPSEFELMLKLYTGEHINITEKITGFSLHANGRIVSPRETLSAKGYVIRDGLNGYGGKLTQIGYEKMNKIEKLVNLNWLGRFALRLNDYPAIVGLIGVIIGAMVSILAAYISK